MKKLGIAIAAGAVLLLGGAAAIRSSVAPRPTARLNVRPVRPAPPPAAALRPEGPEAAPLSIDAPAERRLAVGALLQQRTPEALAALVHAARNDVDPAVRKDALAAVAARRDPSTPPEQAGIVERTIREAGALEPDPLVREFAASLSGKHLSRNPYSLERKRRSPFNGTRRPAR